MPKKDHPLTLLERLRGEEEFQEYAELLDIWKRALAAGGDVPGMVYLLIGPQLKQREMLRPGDYLLIRQHQRAAELLDNE